jgi:spermidine synthase
LIEKEKGRAMRPLLLGLIYLMFFLSGGAALIYQVAWVRSLTLIFGGSHLAVTIALSIFMAGLAIGGYTIGKYVDHIKKPLRLYGLLEIGIAFFALVFIGLMKLYPSIYIPLAQGKDNAHLYLTWVRVLFSVVALIVPTSLMGGTLPVLSRFVSRQPKNLGPHLSFLYGINTLGGVLGALAGGFFFLRFYAVSTTLYFTILLNAFIGLAALFLQEKTVLASETPEREDHEILSAPSSAGLPFLESVKSLFPLKLVLWGIGISGFCALGYEVLWSRTLTIVAGASVYSFTTMLVAFLTGIALGSMAYGILPKIFRMKARGIGGAIAWFGIVQVIIGVSALLVTLYLRDLPMNLMRLHRSFQAFGISLFGLRMWSNFAIAFSYMVIPSFFMGVAFPLAGRVHAEYKRLVGTAVGEVLAYNTIGAILGAAISGFIMIYLFGIERSLQMLTLINIGFGILILFSLSNRRVLNWGIPGLTLTILLFLALNQSAFRIWDMKYFAIFRSNQLEAFDTPEKIRDAVENTDVLYYAEGIESIVSVIKVKGGEQSFLTNGRVEASSHVQGQQVMFALSHLPMLLHRKPQKALVVGLGSGMSLGAISVHPDIEEVTLVEIEPKVIGVARIFGAYNHNVLQNPKLKVIINDGRNFLMTTKSKFDLITADPIHPWFRGASYLYTSEYFKLVSEHLLPGGIACQWLPIYELSPEDVKSVVATFMQHFRHTMLWLTHYDAEIIGSNEPILMDERALDRRIAAPAISSDLKRVMMGSAVDLLSYFVMGTKGMKDFAQGGIINTDDNLYLEFSAPFSIGKSSVMGANVMALTQHREDILPYLIHSRTPRERTQQEKRWAGHRESVGIMGQALALYLEGGIHTPEFKKLMEELDRQYPRFAPLRFLKNETMATLEIEPRLLQKTAFILLNEKGAKIRVEISAVLVPVSKERVSVAFVDNDARVIYGELYFSGPNQVQSIDQFTDDVMTAIRAAYHHDAMNAFQQGGQPPSAAGTLRKVKEVITAKIEGKKSSKNIQDEGTD